MTRSASDGGRWATGPGEVVIDRHRREARATRSARPRAHLHRGEAPTSRSWASPASATVKSLGTATAAVFDLRTAQQLFDKQAQFDSILVGGKEGVAGGRRRAAASRRSSAGAQVQTAPRTTASRSTA